MSDDFEEKRLTVLEHLDELRQRLVVSVIALLIGSAAAFNFTPALLRLARNHIIPGQRLYTSSVLEPFMVRFKLAFLLGFVIASPVIFYQILAFLTPALKRQEKKVLFPMVFFLVILFTAGAALGYYFVLPLGAKWLMNQGQGMVKPIINISNFINFVLLFIIGFGVAFETPLVLAILMRLGVVSRQALRKNWRFAYITILTIAAIATPDWSLPPMLILAGSMILLYELTLLIVRWW